MAEKQINYTFPQTEMFRRFKENSVNKDVLQRLFYSAISSEAGILSKGRSTHSEVIVESLKSLRLEAGKGMVISLATYIKSLNIPSRASEGNINSIIAKIYEANGIRPN